MFFPLMLANVGFVRARVTTAMSEISKQCLRNCKKLYIYLYLPACEFGAFGVDTVDMLLLPLPTAEALVTPAALERLVLVGSVRCQDVML